MHIIPTFGERWRLFFFLSLSLSPSLSLSHPFRLCFFAIVYFYSIRTEWLVVHDVDMVHGCLLLLLPPLCCSVANPAPSSFIWFVSVRFATTITESHKRFDMLVFSTPSEDWFTGDVARWNSLVRRRPNAVIVTHREIYVRSFVCSFDRMHARAYVWVCVMICTDGWNKEPNCLFKCVYECCNKFMVNLIMWLGQWANPLLGQCAMALTECLRFYLWVRRSDE